MKKYHPGGYGNIKCLFDKFKFPPKREWYIFLERTFGFDIPIYNIGKPVSWR
jgi:hypothetical protein